LWEASSSNEAELKRWSSDNPKASLMKRKRSAIVHAARRLFLEGGYAKTSMDGIADAAGVGIKTVYRHFENKDDLFSAVMRAACNPSAFDELSGEEQEKAKQAEQPWFSKPPRTALLMAGVEYLQHVLSAEQLALYRVVTQDAHLFPELGKHYREQVIERRDEVFGRYLDRWAPAAKWKIKDKRAAAVTFSGLLKAGLFEDALHGLRRIDEPEIAAHAHLAAAQMLVLLNSHAV
jgi:TetR/AcrR family transcriptional repressor of mexJK operon